MVRSAHDGSYFFDIYPCLIGSGPWAYAEEVKLQQEKLVLNANLEKAEDWPSDQTVLITHGTLFHNKSELITVLQNLLSPEAGASLLDVGCGAGHFSRRFARVGFSVTGIDPDFAALKFARVQGDDIH